MALITSDCAAFRARTYMDLGKLELAEADAVMTAIDETPPFLLALSLSVTIETPT